MAPFLTLVYTTLGLALGLEVKGEIIRGLPCIKRLNQLYCPTAGNMYPSKKIERFIDENKALLRRMYGDFQSPDLFNFQTRKKRSAEEEDEDSLGPLHADDPRETSYFASLRRNKRQSFRNPPSGRTTNNPDLEDACESTVEIVTPYWASNSAGKIRAIVNTQHFEQAIHQEVCFKTTTRRCGGDCSCEQKYKWHRLLAYDPDNDCKGIFVDWFLFPSCCICGCMPLPDD